MIRRKINATHTLFKTNLYPSISIERGGYKALLGIGGNVGDTVRRFEHLFWFFRKSPFIRILETAPILKNPPFGYTQQDDFYNSVILIETKLSAKALLRYVLRVENKFGRKRSFKDAPRTLDIDIIFYENDTIDTPNLIVPHIGWMNRSSVLIPLSYIRSRSF